MGTESRTGEEGEGEEKKGKKKKKFGGSFSRVFTPFLWYLDAPTPRCVVMPRFCTVFSSFLQRIRTVSHPKDGREARQPAEGRPFVRAAGEPNRRKCDKTWRISRCCSVLWLLSPRGASLWTRGNELQLLPLGKGALGAPGSRCSTDSCTSRTRLCGAP